MRRMVAIVVIAAAVVSVAGMSSFAATQAETSLGDRLAALLRAGRSVVSEHQSLINDPTIGDKNLDGDRIVQEAAALFAAQTGAPPLTEESTEAERRIIQAQLDAMREVVEDHEAQIDTKGIGFKGFIPAVFGRLVNERFADKVGQYARVKVTAPPDLVRNRKARPDTWEREAMETRLLKPEWPKGQAFTAVADVEGRPAFRMLIPEYYSSSCLTCHGKPAGEVDVTGYPKEGRSEGDLAGAISITLFR